jgi:putative DNA primase/helicase
MLDFNPAPPTRDVATGNERDEIRAALLSQIESVLLLLLPAAKRVKGKLVVGDVLGSPGRSLEIEIIGERAGLWIDRATGNGGDIFDLFAANLGCDVHIDFARVLELARSLLGRPMPVTGRTAGKRKKDAATDDLGPATAKWDYFDADGHLIACVYRYDPVDEDGVQRKEFRPWDAKRRKMTPPDPRPLYNQPGLLPADLVILVEGEKCAQALIDASITATTAMHGANAPVDKTDWSPVAGKAVLVWPDKDKPGWEYGLRAAEAVLAAGASSCAVLLPPDDKPAGWDAADALAEDFDVVAFIERGERYVMQPTVPSSGGVSSGDGTDGERSVWATEDALALAFTRKFAEDWRYVCAWGRWLVWTGQRWQHEETLKAQHLIRNVCRDAALSVDSHRTATKLASSSTVGGVERLARTDRRHAATSEEWDADPWLLNTPGGALNLHTGLLTPHERTDRSTKITTATPKGECPVWLTFLASATNGDEPLQSYLARMVGYALTGSTREHALFFIYGTGGNGKSVFINTIASILGEYATSAPMDTFMESRSDRHPTDMAGLRGARMVCSVETEQGRRWAESKVKSMTGGDPISARFMRQDFFQFSPQFKLVIAGNHKPAIRNIDEAMRRRLHLIPFTVTIPAEKRDKHLTEKLLAERDGILAWAVAGCLEWQRTGLRPPQSVVEATDEYFEAEDALGRWIAERCVLHSNAKALTIELFNDWKAWADSVGEYVGSNRRFSDSLLSRRFEKWRNSIGIRGFVGIGLKEPASAPQTSYPYIND